MSSSSLKLKRLAIYWTGWSFVALGILGMFLPVLQGILFLLIGLLLLSKSSPRAERLLNRLSNRFPTLRTKLDQATTKAAHVQRKIGAHFTRHVKKLSKPKVRSHPFKPKHNQPEHL